MGSTRLEEPSITAQKRFDVDASTTHVIGASIPDVAVQLRALEGYIYSMIWTSAKLDDAVTVKTGAVTDAAEIAAAELDVRRAALGTDSMIEIRLQRIHDIAGF